MNEDVKAKWIARLEDPSARQGRGALSTNRGDCCLGVLCKIAVEEGVIPEPEGVSHQGALVFSGNDQVLPREVASWAGLTGPDKGNPMVVSPVNYSESDTFSFHAGDRVGLASLNDHALNFVGIAGVIREQL